MNDLERRLVDGRPPDVEPGTDVEARLLAAVMGRRRPARPPDGWRRAWRRPGRGRLLGVAVLLLAGAGAAALATGVFDRGPSATVVAGAPRADWGAPVTLGRSSEPARPRVAMDAAGDTMVAWTASGTVRAAFRPRGGDWRSSRPLSTPGARSGDVSLAFARDGRAAVAVWRERRQVRIRREVLRLPDGTVAGTIVHTSGGHYALLARRWRPRSGWGAPVEVARTGATRRDMATPVVASLTSGDLIVWTRGDALEARLVDPAGRLGKLESIAPADGGQPTDPVVAASGNDALVGWTDRKATADPTGFLRVGYSVRVSARRASGWTTPEWIARGSRNNPYPSVALAPEAAAVAWTDSSAAGPPRIAASRRGAAGGWGVPAVLSPPGRPAFAPNAALDGDHRALVQWSAHGATQFTSSQGAGDWSPPSSAGTEGLVSEYSRTVPTLASDGAGRIIAVFGQRNGLSVRNWRPGGPFGPPRRAFTGSGWQYGAAGLAAAPTGAAALVVTTTRTRAGRGTTWSLEAVVREPAGRRTHGEGS